MNVDVIPNVAYIWLFDGTHQYYKYAINKFNFPMTTLLYILFKHNLTNLYVDKSSTFLCLRSLVHLGTGPTLIYSDDRVHVISLICISYRICEIDCCSLFMSFF
jgi:hypothetical protein